jgi:hypothetical protein
VCVCVCVESHAASVAVVGDSEHKVSAHLSRSPLSLRVPLSCTTCHYTQTRSKITLARTACRLHCLCTAYALSIRCQACFYTHIHCIWTAYSLPITASHCLCTAYSLPIHSPYSLPIHCLSTAHSLPITAYSLPIHSLVLRTPLETLTPVTGRVLDCVACRNTRRTGRGRGRNVVVERFC